MNARKLIAIFCLTSTPFIASANDQAMSEVKSNIEPFAYKGAITPSTLPDPKSFTKKTVDLIKFSSLKCKVKWDERCSGEQIITAPQGWQVCKPLYRVTSQRRGSYSVSPTDWYTNDPESPDRFRAYKYNLSAVGSGNIFDREGGSMQLKDVGIQIISASANNKARYQAGCTMPAHD